mgnify:FL=1
MLFRSIINIITGCKQDAGPCDYYQYEALAKVVSIEAYNKDSKKLYHVGLKFNNSSLKQEIQYLDEIKEIEIDDAFLNRNKIQKGFSYQALVSEIKEGDCTPLFISFNHQFKTE